MRVSSRGSRSGVSKLTIRAEASCLAPPCSEVAEVAEEVIPTDLFSEVTASRLFPEPASLRVLNPEDGAALRSGPDKFQGKLQHLIPSQDLVSLILSQSCEAGTENLGSRGPSWPSLTLGSSLFSSAQDAGWLGDFRPLDLEVH